MIMQLEVDKNIYPHPLVYRSTFHPRDPRTQYNRLPKIHTSPSRPTLIVPLVSTISPTLVTKTMSAAPLGTEASMWTGWVILPRCSKF